MFSNLICGVLIVFGFCGFQPELKTSFLYRKLSLLVFTVHVMISSVFTFCLFKFTFWIWVNMFSSKLHMVNEFGQFYVVLLNYWVIIIESFCQQKNQRQLWQVFRNNHKYSCLKMKSFFLKFLTYITIYTILTGYILINLQLNVHLGILIVSILGLLLEVSRMRIFFYIFYLELMKIELKTIENVLIPEFKSKVFISNRRNVINQSRWIQKYYQSIYKLNVCINSIFGWSNLSTILFSFEAILVSINTIYCYGVDKSTMYLYGVLTYRNILKKQNNIKAFINTIFFCFLVYWLWIILAVLCLFYTFKGADDCEILVRIEHSELFSFIIGILNFLSVRIFCFS